MAYGNNASLWGLRISGDIGGLTVYTDRFGKKVAYPKAPPDKPPSPLQIQQRRRFTASQKEYGLLNQAQKLAYENLTKAASLCMTGQNLFIHVALCHAFQLLLTLMRQWEITVTPPTYQPFLPV